MKGAFSGAMATRAGLIASADNGTLFLDEIGDLPLAAQAKLLRVLQEREVVPVGGTTPKKVNVLVCSATNVDMPVVAECSPVARECFPLVAECFPVVLEHSATPPKLSRVARECRRTTTKHSRTPTEN